MSKNIRCKSLSDKQQCFMPIITINMFDPFESSGFINGMKISKYLTVDALGGQVFIPTHRPAR